MNKKYIKDHFKFEYEGKANDKAIILGKNYRITILTSRLIRFEYSEDDHFEDQPTQTVLFRNFEVPDYKVTDNDNLLIIETNHLVVNYTKEKFSPLSLWILLKDVNRIWRYGDIESGNLGGTARTLDRVNGATMLEKGIISKDGFATLDDSEALVFDELCWLNPRPKLKDLYFFGYGLNYKNALKDYYRLCGKTPMIPRYILGNWWSRYWAYNEEELKTLIQSFAKNQIPLSVCIIDMDWHIVDVDSKYIKVNEAKRWSYGWTGYTWNKNLFPEPKRILDFLHENQLKVALNLHPADGIRPHEFCYEDVANFMGINPKTLDTIHFDISDPKFVSAYFDLVHHPHENMGVDFWWIDWQQGNTSKIDGLDPLWMLNHLHFYDSGRKKSKRPFTFSRYGRYASHRYPIGFSGDTIVSWDTLDFQPYFTATASNIGYGWWSHDIGGHMGGIENGELYTRWIQFGVFSPILRLHSSKNIFSRRLPWAYNEQTLKITSNFMRLRHRLVPYIYSMAYQNYADYIPLVRPVYYEHPHIQESYTFRNQYYFGSELLVAPITKPISIVTQKADHKIYLPEDEYFDFFTKEYYQGGKIISEYYTLEQMPVFAKAGAIIPLSEEKSINGVDLPTKLTVEIFPLKNNQFDLYEDDGISQDYMQGSFNITSFILTNENNNISLTIEKSHNIKLVDNRTYRLMFNSITQPKSVTLSQNINYTTEYNNNTVIIELLNDDFNTLTIELSNITVLKKSFLNDKLHSLLLEGQFNQVKKMNVYQIILSNLSNKEKLNKIYDIDGIPSEILVALSHYLS